MRKFLIVLLMLTGVVLVVRFVAQRQAQTRHDWDEVLTEVPTL